MTLDSCADCHTDVATDRKTLHSRSAPGEGELGCLFDQISNLVEPSQRPHMEVRTRLVSHGRHDVARIARPTKNS